MTRNRRLGRGLEALLGTPLEDEQFSSGDAPAAPTAGDRPAPAPERLSTASVDDADSSPSEPEPVKGQIVDLNVYEIDNNPFQPRRQFHPEEIASLAASLQEHAQLQPILVRRDGQRYQLISGERRLRAAIHAGLPTVRAEIREADDRLVAELALIENLQRKDLNAVEKAISFRNYINQHACTQDELAGRLKLDRSTIANLMRLLELPEPILNAIQADELTAGHGRALLPLGDESEQVKVARLIQDEKWSVRQTEQWVQERIREEDEEEAGVVGAASNAKKRGASPQVGSLERELRMALGTKVDVRQTAKGRGRIVIHFANNDEFERLLTMLQTEQQQTAAAA